MEAIKRYETLFFPASLYHFSIFMLFSSRAIMADMSLFPTFPIRIRMRLMIKGTNHTSLSLLFLMNFLPLYIFLPLGKRHVRISPLLPFKHYGYAEIPLINIALDKQS